MPPPREPPRDTGPLALALDPDENDVVALPSDCQADAVARGQTRRVQRLARTVDGHHLHRAHTERTDGLMTDEDKLGSGAANNLATNLIGRRTHDGPPKTCGKKNEEKDEQ